jgi:hypothetical protein
MVVTLIPAGRGAVQAISKTLQAMGYAGYRNLLIALLAMRVLLENSTARVLPS